MNFYLNKNGQKLGPYSVEQIQIFLKQGLITTNDQVWADGWPSWIPIGSVPGIDFQSEIQKLTSSAQDSDASIRAIPAPLPISASLSTGGNTNFSICRNGSEIGEWKEEDVRVLYQKGELLPTDHYWKEGMAEWVPLLKLLERTPPSPPVISESRERLMPFSNHAITSFVLALLGILLFPVAGFWIPIVAIVEACVAKRSISKHGYRGLWMVTSTFWIALLTFLCVVGLSILIAFHSSSPNTAIIEALKQDDQLSKEYKSERMSIHDSGVSGDAALDQVAQLTSDLVGKMKAIPISDCPSDFQEAYTKHINCWSDDADAIANHPHIQSGDEALLEGFLRGLGGDPTGGAFEKQDEIDSYLNTEHERSIEIKQSWEDVQAVAIRYGVKPDDY